jgi:polysaccharide biosynthesis transport protein
MDLHHYLRVLRKHLVLIVAATLLCAAGAMVTSLGTTPAYEGSAKLLIVAEIDPADGVSSALQGTMLSQQLIESFAQILESRAIAEAALRLDPSPLTPSQLQAKIHAKPVTDTLLIDLKVEDADPGTARRLTNGVARAFIASVPKLQTGSSLRVSLVEAALTPSQPVRPQTRLNLVLGLLLGLTLGVGLAFLREFLDRSVRTPEELEAAAGFPVVGTIPPFKAAKQPLPVADQPRTAAAEAFRKLRTNFGFLSVDRDSVCCVITSPNAADGKSTVVANLAVALAHSGQRVVVVDADLRKPSLHRFFDLSQRVGTTTVLLDQADVHDALQQPGAGLPAVLTAGQLPPNPSELLGSRRMANLLAELRAAYEVVLVDCAPILPVTDPMVVSQFADGLLVIVRSGTTTRDHATAVKAACAKAGATVFGTVLNVSAVTEADQPATYAYYGETGKRSEVMAEDALDLIAGNGTRPAHLENGRAARHRRVRSGSR